MKQNGNKKERKQRKYEGFRKKAEASAVNNAEAEAAREKFQEKLKETVKSRKKEKKYVRVSGNQ